MLCASLSAHADEKSIPMDRVSWSFVGDSFSCQLKLSAEDHGSVELRQDAGSDLKVIYSPLIPSENSVLIGWAGAPWQEMSQSRRHSTRKNNHQYVADSTAAMELMRALDEGQWVAIKTNGTTMTIPSIRWEEPAHSFHLCRFNLSPMSILQARDTTLYYTIGQRAVSEDHLETIHDIAKYINLDPEVSRVLIDSYTDNTGNRLANLQLSRERAADVAAALRDAGVPESMIESRGHGQRFPSANNTTKEGRDKSRKVMIRIIRGPLPEQSETIEQQDTVSQQGNENDYFPN